MSSICCIFLSVTRILLITFFASHLKLQEKRNRNPTQTENFLVANRVFIWTLVHEGRRNYEFLKLYLKPGQTELNRETLKVAEQIRAFRELDLQELCTD